MSPTSVPEDSTPPWPANPLPHTLDATTVKPAPKAKKKAEEEPEKGKANIVKIAGVGAAVGIGSAAIVAALLYTNRRKGAAKD